VPGAAQEGVGAFAEPDRKRIVMPMDEPPDLLYRLIVHELTHQFEFDMIPQSLIRREMPLWINEGLSDYMTGYWKPLDLMMVRDAAVADIVPKMSQLTDYGGFNNPRMIYNLGHAVFEFIENRWGKKGLQDYILALRKSVIGGGEDPFREAFNLSNEEFDQQFEKYLKDRFKSFRDKERSADYGRNLAPDREHTKFSNALSVEPSPIGELLAVVTGNSHDQEADIVLLSAHDGSVIRTLTRGFDQDQGFEFIVMPGSRWNTVPWMSWSPSGDTLAYFVRNEKWRTLIIQNVNSGKIEQRFPMRTLDDPESPDFSPDGRKVAFAALQGGTGDIFVLDLETKAITNATKDSFGDSGPTWSPDGASLVYVARISGNEKLFRVDLSTGEKTQITFGTHDDGSAQFIDANTLVFSSTATDPAQPLDPEIARNGNIYNIWTLNLKNGELRQYTDALGGNVNPVVLRDDGPGRIGFISYYKTDWELHAVERKAPIATVASSDFGAPGPVIDFQAPLSHTLVRENIKKKGKFEKMFLDGRPPVNVGVTSGGNVFGGTSVTVSDVLGDQQFNFYAESVSQYRTLSFSYTNLAHRINWAVQGYSQTQFYYGQVSGVLYDPVYAPYIDRDQAESTQTVRGGSIFAILPLDRFRRLELFGSYQNYYQQYNNPQVAFVANDYQTQQYGQPLIQQSGSFVPLGISYVSETTIFRDFGPLAGSTMKLTYQGAPKIGNSLTRQTVDVDMRKYVRLGGNGLLALRARGFSSWGAAPDFMYYGGNSEMRGYEYLQFIGNDAAFLNAELRFPLIEAMLTPIGVMGGIRGVLYFDVGGGALNGLSPDPARGAGAKFKVMSSADEIYTPLVFNGIGLEPGIPRYISGFRLVDSRASYGMGVQTMAFGFPVHLDWSWRTLFNREWEDALFAAYGGTNEFRAVQFGFWMGYDF
jgi:Tol biopolymer transport system component